MMFRYLLFLLLIQNCYSKNVEPTFIFKSKGFVNDFVIDNSKIYVANDEGSVEIFDLATQKLSDEIFIEPIFTAQKVWQNSKVLSVDRYNGKTLIVSNDVGPYRNIWVHDGTRLQHIIKPKDKSSVKEARFIDDDKYILGTLGYEISLYNTADKYSSYTTQPEQSSFSDLALSEDKKTIVTSSESGQVVLSDTKTGKVLKNFKALNLDKVFQLAYKNGTVITAGQDRKVAVFPKNGENYVIKSKFLVYSVALSPSGKTGIYSSNTDNDLQIFDIKNGKKRDVLKGHYGIPTVIKFYDEKSLFSAGYENKIFYWRID
jgi:WD40 repeat protein